MVPIEEEGKQTNEKDDSVQLGLTVEASEELRIQAPQNSECDAVSEKDVTSA